MTILLLNHPDQESETWMSGREIFDAIQVGSKNLCSQHTYQDTNTLEAALKYHDAVVVNDLADVKWLDSSQLLYHKTLNLSTTKDPEKICEILS